MTGILMEKLVDQVRKGFQDHAKTKIHAEDNIS